MTEHYQIVTRHFKKHQYIHKENKSKINEERKNIYDLVLASLMNWAVLKRKIIKKHSFYYSFLNYYLSGIR